MLRQSRALAAIRGEVHHALRVILSKGGIAQCALCFNKRGVLLRIDMRPPFDRPLRAGERWDAKFFYWLMPAHRPLFR